MNIMINGVIGLTAFLLSAVQASAEEWRYFTPAGPEFVKRIATKGENEGFKVCAPKRFDKTKTTHPEITSAWVHEEEEDIRRRATGFNHRCDFLAISSSEIEAGEDEDVVSQLKNEPYLEIIMPD